MLQKIHSIDIYYDHLTARRGPIAGLRYIVQTVVALIVGVDEEVGLAESARARGGHLFFPRLAGGKEPTIQFAQASG